MANGRSNFIFSPGGGIYYHTRALWRSKRLWSPFREQIGDWLADWLPQNQKKIVLVGPSAAYCLPPSFLETFQDVVGIDPDPLARLLFKKQFSKIRAHWEFHDYLGTTKARLDPAGLDHLLSEFSHHAILFCNVLGQLPLYFKKNSSFETDFNNWKRYFNESMKGRCWASFHDRYSTASKPNNDRLQTRSEISLEQLATKFFNSRDQAPRLHFNDHLTGGIMPEQSRIYLGWKFSGQCYHIVEAIHSGGHKH